MSTAHTGAETIQGRKLFKGGNYSRIHGDCIFFAKMALLHNARYGYHNDLGYSDFRVVMIQLQIVLNCTAQGPAGRQPTIVEVGEHGQPNIAIVERKFVALKLGLKRAKAVVMTLHLITLTYTAVKYHYMQSNIDIIIHT